MTEARTQRVRASKTCRSAESLAAFASAKQPKIHTTRSPKGALIMRKIRL